MDLPKEVLWYGKNEALAEAKTLRAGALEITYTSGDLRDIRIGKHDVLRMIYVTLRDRNWGTIRPFLENEKITIEPFGFRIEYDSLYHIEDIHFKCHVSITGDANHQVVFEINGKALSDFQTNRTGLCVLHPIDGCSGQICEITTLDGKKLQHEFPRLISPHQPMKNIMEMAWKIDAIGEAKIQFEGEIFEMEDQRNWTDDSYKTYCRPLVLPYPYTLKKGDKIHQRITLNVQQVHIEKDDSIKAYHFTYDQSKKYALPKLGIGRTASNSQPGSKELDLIRHIGFDFYDITVVFNASWKSDLKNAIAESKMMSMAIALKILFTENFTSEIEQLSSLLNSNKAEVNSILILESASSVTTDSFIINILPPLKKAFPKTEVGAGTQGFFTGLNRNRIANKDLNFLSYSLNPQVHAFDNQTLIENLHGQSATVDTAKSFADKKEIHVSPVTFKIQKSLTSKSQEKVSQDEYREQIDERQMSLFGAGWVLGSIKYLAQSGAAAVSYFETTGEKGIIQGEKSPLDAQVFQVKSGAIFPLYYVFKEVLKNKNANILYSTSSHPSAFEGIVLEANGKKTFLLSNVTSNTIEVRIDNIAADALVKKLDEKSVQRAMYEHEDYEKSPYCDFKFEQPITTIKMRPFAFVVIVE